MALGGGWDLSGYKFHVDVAGTVGRYGPRYSRAQKWLDNEILKDCDPYVPMRTGTLVGSGIRGTSLGDGRIVYSAPYARSMYYGLGMNFSKDKHQLACAEWFEKAKATKKDKWINGANKVLKGE